MFNRVLLIVLDSVGAGEMPDSYKYGDEGADTLKHIYEKMNPKLDNLSEIGLFKMLKLPYNSNIKTIGAYGKLTESSAGKDTTTGHWEMAGLQIDTPFPTYPNGFPESVISEFKKIVNTNILGNCVASGTQIIQEFGDEHVKTGYPIVYTSADSVFQIACHEDLYPIEKLYEICEKARAMLTGEHCVGRVIARPFVGSNGSYKRTANRKDFSIEPFSDTILDHLKNNGYETFGIGKIEDIFFHKGLTGSNHAHGNEECINATYEAMDSVEKGIIFVNLIDFDMIHGHRRDVAGYSKELEKFDLSLKAIKNKMKDDDLLIITADHGCDPTFKGTDHTREYVPLLVWHKKLNREIDLGIGKTFRNIAATISENFNLNENFGAQSFYKTIKE